MEITNHDPGEPQLNSRFQQAQMLYWQELRIKRLPSSSGFGEFAEINTLWAKTMPIEFGLYM